MATEKRVDNKGRKLPDGFSQRQDGRYMARFTYCGKRYTLYDLELHKLKEKVNAKKYELEHGLYRKNTSYTLNEWFYTWIETYYKGKVKISTFHARKAMYERYAKDSNIGNMKLQGIKSVHIVDFYKSLSGDLKYQTIKILHHVINGLMETAVENDLILSNPASGALKYLEKSTVNRSRALTIEEQKRVLQYLESNGYWKPYKPLFIVAFNTGMRIGELCALQWGDIDYDSGLINVSKTLQYIKGDNGKMQFHVGTPKTKKSIRTIPMTAAVKNAFLEQQELLQHYPYKNVKCVDVCGYSDFVFITKNGTPREEHNINHCCKRIVAGLNKREVEQARKENREPCNMENFAPHSMRHTFTTRAFESGMKPKAIQEILGHCNISMTMDIYTHLTEGMKKQEIDVFEKYMNN